MGLQSITFYVWRGFPTFFNELRAMTTSRYYVNTFTSNPHFGSMLTCGWGSKESTLHGFT
jgi:hypothetical protein